MEIQPTLMLSSGQLAALINIAHCVDTVCRLSSIPVHNTWLCVVIIDICGIFITRDRLNKIFPSVHLSDRCVTGNQANDF